MRNRRWLLGLWLLISQLVLAADNRFAEIPGDAPDFMAVDKAFALSVKLTPETLRLHWQIAPGYYLYRDRLQLLQLREQGGLQELNWPIDSQPLSQRDPNFGAVAIFRQQLDMHSQRNQLAATESPRLDFYIKYQGCVDAGFCYPIQWRHVAIVEGRVTITRQMPLQR